MKKILILGILFLLILIPIGLAQQNNNQEMTQTKSQIQEKVRTQLNQGIDNVLSQVQNQNAKRVLQQNMNRFQEQYKERLHLFEDVEIIEVNEETGDVVVQVREEVSFLGLFKFRLRNQYEMNEEGIQLRKQFMHYFLGE